MAQPARPAARPAAATQQLARTNGAPKAPLIPIAPGLMPDPEQLGRIALSVIGDGNIDAMSDEQKTRFIIEASRMLGLNPVMGPFLIVKFEGKSVLYLSKAGAEQLAGLHGVSTEVTSKGVEYGLLITTVRASVGARFADATGAVAFELADGKPLPIGQRARILKISETQARRRAILALIGLGFLDRPGIPDPDQMLDRHGNLASRPPPRELPASSATVEEMFSDDYEEWRPAPGAVAASAAAESNTQAEAAASAAVRGASPGPGDHGLTTPPPPADAPPATSRMSLFDACASLERRATAVGLALEPFPVAGSDAALTSWHDVALDAVETAETAARQGRQ